MGDKEIFVEDEPIWPQWYSFRTVDIEDEDACVAACKEMGKLQFKDGARWFRFTRVEDGIWLEGWEERPAQEGPFNPPMTDKPADFLRL